MRPIMRQIRLVFCVAFILVIVHLHRKAERKKPTHRSVEVSKEDKKVAKCTSFHSRECTPIPIDVVYTWVNGTDASLQRDLKVAKEQLDAEEALWSVKQECPLSQCIVAPMAALDPGLPAYMTTRELPSVLPSFSAAKSLLRFAKPLQPSDTVSVAVFYSRADAEKAMAGTVKDEKFSISKCYLTTDKEAAGVIRMETLAYLTGFPRSYKVSEMLRGQLTPTIERRITAFELYPETGIALLNLKTPRDLTFLLEVAKNGRLKLDEKQLAISPVYLLWDTRAIAEFSQKRPAPPKGTTKDSVTANRFAENDALLYSLRSLEQHAPWARHVYIVTNGQIPSWLNLRNPRVSIVTHKEIFLNRSHLPTFNSHAIESHLHRIPGISQKFLYLNDDTMFGKDVWLDDFYTPSDGQKVYLAWGLPSCSGGCPANWINNGLCDQQCNNAACQWDGEDCKGRNRASERSTRDEGGLGCSFARALLHVNRLYNLKFGSMIRKVIAHAPNMIDKLVMQELQDTFPEEFRKTSSRRFRHGEDMQYSLAYFYFLMSVKQQTNFLKVFDAADKDHSGILSESEIQALATRIHKQPLKPKDLRRLKNQLIDCSKTLPNDVRELKPNQRVYHNRKMSRVTKELIMNCKPIMDHIGSTFPEQKKYKYQIVGDDEVHFKMLHNDLAEADRIFNAIRRRPRKFICINDDLDHTQSTAKQVQTKLATFYQSMFPQPSQFELPKGSLFMHEQF